MAIAASAILSFVDNFVGLVAEEAGLWQFQVFRALMALPILWVIGLVTRRTIRPKHLWRWLGRSLAVSAGLLIYFASLGTLPVAQAGAGLFSAPLWVALFSVALFGQRLGGLGVFAIIAGFGGALMLLQPDVASLSAASLFPLTAGLFYGFGMMLTGRLCARESPLSLALGVFLVIGVASAAMLIVTSMAPGESFISRPFVPPSLRFLWLTAIQAVGAAIAVILIAEAYRTGTAALVAVFEYSFLIFACLWAFLLWNLPTNSIAATGIAIVVAAGILMAINERRRESASTAV
ncbi:MAG: DMT family transporter [Boseongicola sp.]|nr:DMT family transporter [Boseongicola sp.]MDE0345675.1 DMT family transporter [Boseongicola sp.]